MHSIKPHLSFWELLPLKGLGPIQFLMDKSAVQAFHGELGAITAERSETLEQQQQNLNDTFICSVNTLAKKIWKMRWKHYRL